MFVLQDSINIFIYNNYLFFVNDLGITSVQLSYFCGKLSVCCNNNFLNIRTINNDSANIIIKNKLLSYIEHVLSELIKVSKKKLLLFGVGFRCWIYRNSFVLKLGFSNDLIVRLPIFVKIICLKSSLFLLKCCSANKLNRFMIFLCSLRIPDVYKGKGILSANSNYKKVHLKQGKHN
jgi:ribosomal protein L6P/L9E